MAARDRMRYETEVAKLFSARNNRELAERYDALAGEYDEKESKFGYAKRILEVVVGLVCRHVAPDDGTLLDAGGGTGLLADMLAPLGYREMVDLDLSQGMLDVASRKGLYKEVRQMVLGEHLDFPDDSFAAVVAAAVFNVNHAPPESFDELIRTTRANGYIIFTVRADLYVHNGFKDKQDALESEGKWKLVDATEPFTSWSSSPPQSGANMPWSQDSRNRGFVYRVS